MAGPITIAFDVMGSDFGPAELVAGAAGLSLEAPQIHALLVGDRDVIAENLREIRHSGERISVHHAGSFVTMDEKPAEALKRKPDASISVAAQLVAEGEADALVTAGNTGAGILACAHRFKLIPGIRRAALAAVYPTRRLHGEKEDPFSLILDVGATVEASADDLVAFAVMGASYAKIISRNPNPTVALLSNGTEPLKGPARVVEAHRKLKEMPGLRFGHSQRHRGCDCVRWLRGKCLFEDARGRAGDGDRARRIRPQIQAALARRFGDALVGHSTPQGSHRLATVWGCSGSRL